MLGSVKTHSITYFSRHQTWLVRLPISQLHVESFFDVVSCFGRSEIEVPPIHRAPQVALFCWPPARDFRHGLTFDRRRQELLNLLPVTEKLNFLASRFVVHGETAFREERASVRSNLDADILFSPRKLYFT